MADEEWIEHLARSLCRESGFDPGAVADATEPDLTGDAKAPSLPTWTAYIARAQVHVTAARALKMI